MNAKPIAELVAYATLKMGVKEEDRVYLTNLLLKLFKFEEPYEGEIDYKKLEALKVPDTLLEPLKERLLEIGYNEVEAEGELTYALGLLTPIPSKVEEVFNEKYKSSPKEATDYLYNLSVANNYVAKTQIDKNILWHADFDSGASLDISINLSKPEKNNKDIAALLTKKSSSYPKCRLCYENIGYEGKGNFPPRENIRFIPLQLDEEKWYLQYSPYGYFEEHCILFYEHHVPMEISRRILSKLFAFEEIFPHYFIGSNSDLPIVGGSILDHEHFQGGLTELPLLKAKPKEEIALSHYPTTKLYILDFYNTALLVKGKDKEEMLDLAEKILLKWRTYEDFENSIVGQDEKGNHSTITPILRVKDGYYELYLILRNNRCDETYPDGIFHAHPEYAHIKHEGIGLIEAAGLFILPARLKRQGALITDIVKNKTPKEVYLKDNPDLEGFDDMVEQMSSRGISAETYMSEVCRNILLNVAVFKDDEKGRHGLHKFLKECDL